MTPLGLRSICQVVLIGGERTFSGYYDKIFPKVYVPLEYRSFYYNHHNFLALFNFVCQQFGSK